MPRVTERSGPLLSGNRRRPFLRASLVGIAALIGLVLAGGEALADPASPITVTKTASSNPVASGAQLTYTIVVKNTAGGSISNVVLSDQVNGLGVIQSPPALPQLILTSTKGSCSQGGTNGNLVTCAVGTMAGGESFTVTIRGQVTAGAGTTLNNTASVTGTKSAQNFTTQSNAVSVLVTGGAGGQSDLTINKTGPTSVAPNGAMTYTLTVNNIGTANATNIKVVDTLPTGVGLALSNAITTTSLFTCLVTGTPLTAVTVTCAGGAVNAGQNGTITINATAPGVAGSITNTAVVDPDNTISETNELNNTSASVNTAVGSSPPPTPLLTIQKTDGSPSLGAWASAAGPDPVIPGQKLTYVIQIVNTATGNNATANDVVMTDNTQGLDAASIVASQTIVGGQLAKTDGCVVAAPQVKCTVKALSGGSNGKQTITISGTVQQSAGSSIFNTATVTGNVKNTGVSNTASEVTTIRPAVDLTITKDDTPDPVCARSWPTSTPNQHLPSSPSVPLANGTPTALLDTAGCLGGLTYPLVIGNSGIAAATNVVVRDPLPPGLIFDSYENADLVSAGFTCSLQAGNVVQCTGGTIPAADVKHLNLLFTAPPSTGSITNTVYVDPNNAIFEPDETNNTASQTTTVNTGIDLAVWKNDAVGDDPPGDGAPILDEGFDPIATNGTGTYTIIVDNVGPQDSTGIKLVDTLPAGTRFLSVNSDSGFTCSHNGAATGGDVTCVGGHLIGTEGEFYSPAGSSPLLPGDQFATIKIKFFATKFVQPKMHNIVRVDPDNTIPEIDELNNTATDDTTVGVGNDDDGAFNQLTIAKAQTSPSGSGVVATNGTLTYELTVSNLGTDPVSNVVVKDFLPTGARFISAADSTGSGPPSAAFFCIHDGSATGGVVTCTGGDFDGSLNTIPVGNIIRKIKVTVFAPATPGTYVNHAVVDPDDIVPEGNEFDNDAQVTTTVAPCVGATQCTDQNAFYELTIEKTQDSPANPVARNGIITYNLKVSNLGSDSVHGVTATDRLPAGFRFIDAKDSAGTSDPNAFTCAGPDGSGVVTCGGGSLSGTVNTLGPAPTFRTIVIRVFAPDEPGTYSNLAFVDPNNTIPEGNEFNNQASVDTTVTNGGNGAYIDLAVTKTQTFPDPTPPDASVAPGGGIQYQLHVTNGGAATAFNVVVRDALPQHVTFHNARDAAPNTAGAFSCAESNGVLDCTGGTIPAGGSRDVLVNVTVDSSIDEFALDPADVHILITNQAIVDPNNAIGEGDETNNTSSVDTTIKPPLDLTLEKQGPGSASPNESTTYTITVHNVTKVGSGATATGVKIVDPLPTGLIPLNVEADPGNFRCDLQEDTVNKVTCIGDLPAGTDVKITITAFVTLQSGTLDNEACVDPDDTIAETDETNNCKHAIGSVETPTPDLQIVKTADKSSVTAGDTLTYTLSASNVGTGDTTASLSVSDQVPDELTVTNINPDVGWDCSTSSGNQITCTMDSLAAGASAQIVVTTTVNGSTPLTVPFTNTAQIIGGGETNAANNESSVTTSLGTAKPVDLKVVSLTDDPDPVNHDNTLTYTAVVVNTGTSGTGPGAIVRVALPTTGVPVASMAVTGNNSFTCAATVSDPKTFDCIGDFGASGTPTASTTITATMTVDSGAPPPTELSATVTADPDGAIDESDETNNTKTEETSVSGTVCGGSPCVDLLAIATGPPSIPSGGTGVYNATVQNVGTDAVPSSTVWSIQFMAIGGALVSSVTPTTPGVACAGFGVVICTSTAGSDPMDLAPGASLSFIVMVLDPLPAGAAVTLQVLADNTNTVSELSEGNNIGIAVSATTP